MYACLNRQGARREGVDQGTSIAGLPHEPSGGLKDEDVRRIRQADGVATRRGFDRVPRKGQRLLRDADENEPGVCGN